MNLDELHKVMKGNMTVDQACEGMTDDFEIGHISHRADGDYRKVAQGKWVPVKAAGQQMKQGGGTESDGPNTAMQDERSQFKFRKHITHAIPMGKEEEIALNRISSYFESGKRNASDAIDNYADHLIKENMENGNNNTAQERAVMRIAHAIGYGHELHDKIKRGRNGYDFGYDDEQGRFYEGDDDGFLEPNITEPEPDDEPPYEYDNPAPKMTPDAAPRLTRDTKIRLSRIKREQTQDERRTYKIGEISEKTGLQKTANGWREVKKGGAPAGGNAEVNPITGKPLRPETVAYAKQKQAEAEQKRNTEKTAGGFTLAQNDKIKNAATDVIFKRRGEKLTPADLQREYKMSEPEANEASRRINEYFSSLEKDRQEFAKAGEKKAQNAKPQASPMAGTKKTYEGSGSTKGHKWEAEKVGDKYISTHTWPDGRTDKTEITQKDYETMRTTQGGKSEAPKPASSKPSSELKYYEDMGDRVEELRSQMTTAGPEEKRRLIRESVDLQRRMQTAPFRPKKKR